MKKVTLLFSILVVTSLVMTACAPKTTGGGGGTAAAGMPDLKGRTVTIAVENAYPPFSNIDSATGQGIGWDYDFGAELCMRLNCVPEFKEAAWDGIFPAMQAGEYDMLADGVTFTMERSYIVDFSIPYVIIGQVLLVRADDTHTMDDFLANTNLKIATQIQTTNEIVAHKTFGAGRVQSFEDFGAAVLALISVDVDGVVIDNVSASGYMRENYGKIKIGFQITSDEMLAFVFPPGSDLVAPVNAAMRAMHDDGTLEQINKKWGLSQ